jgi:hypothetical protein
MISTPRVPSAGARKSSRPPAIEGGGKQPAPVKADRSFQLPIGSRRRTPDPRRRSSRSSVAFQVPQRLRAPLRRSPRKQATPAPPEREQVEPRRAEPEPAAYRTARNARRVIARNGRGGGGRGGEDVVPRRDQEAGGIRRRQPPGDRVDREIPAPGPPRGTPATTGSGGPGTLVRVASRPKTPDRESVPSAWTPGVRRTRPGGPRPPTPPPFLQGRRGPEGQREGSDGAAHQMPRDPTPPRGADAARPVRRSFRRRLLPRDLRRATGSGPFRARCSSQAVSSTSVSR